MEFEVINQNWLKENSYNNFIEFIKDMKNNQVYKRYNHLYSLFFVVYLFILMSFMFIITPLFFAPLIDCLMGLIDKDFNYLMVSIDQDFNYFIIMDLLISIIPSLLLFICLIYLDYKRLNNIIDYEVNQLQNKLNEKYVDKNDYEKVYLLYELIKNHNVAFKDTYNKCSVSNHLITVQLCELKVNKNQYKKFNQVKYEDPDIKDILNDKVLNVKKLSRDEALQFYDQYLNFDNQNIKTIEEYNELEKRLKDKNKESVKIYDN